MLAPRPRSEQNIFLNACDVGIVSLVKKMRGVSMPSRTYNILAVGKPILAFAEYDSEIAKVIEDEKVGWIVPPQNAEMLLQKVYEIYESREKFKEMGEKSRFEALTKYSLEAALEKYKLVLGKGASDNENYNEW